MSATGEKCGIRRVKSPDDLISGHIEYETETLCGESTCSDECWKSWAFCPYCGKPFENRRALMKVKRWKIEMEFTYGWDDAGWMTGDKPTRYGSEAEANEAIDEFIREVESAVREGYLESGHSRDEFRAVEVEENV